MLSFQIGDRVGDFEVIGVLGSGGMGRVFRVRHVISDRVEAMKVVLPDFLADPKITERFLREIKIHASLVHPNIAGMYTAFQHGNAYLMIMELVEGQSLDTVLTRGAMDPAAAIDVIWQVLSALGYAHAHGVVHRDIKPANIIRTANGTVKVTDFGVARPASGPGLTAAGLLVGSLEYMPPEQIRSQPVDHRADLYSVGVTLHEMISGACPFTGDSEYALMTAHLSHIAPAIHEVVPGLPAELSAVLRKSLAKEPQDRFQSAGEFQEALRPFHRRQYTVETPRPSARTLSATITVPGATPSRQEWDPALLKTLKQELSRHIGPIANVLVEKTARRARSRRELYDALAGEIPSDRDRAAFLRSLP